MFRRSSIAWDLEPSDLPPARFLRSEPRFAGIEENAAFRAMVFRKKRERGGLDSVHHPSFGVLAPIVYIGLLAWLGASGVLTAREYALALLGLAVASTIMWIVRTGARRHPPTERIEFLDRLTRQDLFDLHMTGFPAEEFAVALWAFRCSTPTARATSRHAFLAAALAFAFAAASFVPNAGLGRLLAGASAACAFVAGVCFAAINSTAEHWLPHVAPTLRSLVSTVGEVRDDAVWRLRQESKPIGLAPMAFFMPVLFGRGTYSIAWMFVCLVLGLIPRPSMGTGSLDAERTLRRAAEDIRIRIAAALADRAEA